MVDAIQGFQGAIEAIEVCLRPFDDCDVIGRGQIEAIAYRRNGGYSQRDTR